MEKFHKYQTMYQSMGENGGVSATEFYDHMIHSSEPFEFADGYVCPTYLVYLGKYGGYSDSMAIFVKKAELDYYIHKKPYYKIYNTVLPVFVNTSLQVAAKHVRLPYTAFSIHLPQNNVMNIESIFAYCVLYESENPSVLANANCLNDLANTKHESDYLVLSFQVTKHKPALQYNSALTIGKQDLDTTIEDICMQNIKSHFTQSVEKNSSDILSRDEIISVWRIVFATFFLATGSHKYLQYVEPDLLQDHLDVYRQVESQKRRNRCVKMVKKKGLTGFTIGRPDRNLKLPNGVHIDEDPMTAKRKHMKHKSPNMHYRCAHWRMQACGPKHRDHRLTWIDETIINRKQSA